MEAWASQVYAAGPENRYVPKMVRRELSRRFRHEKVIMSRLINSLRKRCPEGEPRERSRTCGLVVSRSTLNREDGSSILPACTRIVVVRPAHPCGEQQVRERAWPNGEAPVLHSGNESSILSARTHRQRKRQIRLSLPLDVAQLDRAANF